MVCNTKYTVHVTPSVTEYRQCSQISRGERRFPLLTLARSIHRIYPFRNQIISMQCISLLVTLHVRFRRSEISYVWIDRIGAHIRLETILLTQANPRASTSHGRCSIVFSFHVEFIKQIITLKDVA
jgi:hypothetical protein